MTNKPQIVILESWRTSDNKMMVLLEYSEATEMRSGQRVKSPKFGYIWEITGLSIPDPFKDSEEFHKYLDNARQNRYQYILNPMGHEKQPGVGDVLTVFVDQSAEPMANFDQLIQEWTESNTPPETAFVGPDFLEQEANYLMWEERVDKYFLLGKWIDLARLFSILWAFVPYHTDATEERITKKLCHIFSGLVDRYDHQSEDERLIPWVTHTIVDYFFHKASTSVYLTHEFYEGCRKVFTWDGQDDYNTFVTMSQCYDVIHYQPNDYKDELNAILLSHPNEKMRNITEP